ncbi:MAG: hypothetical protein CMC95_05615 [Flavobacteriales bacterium]|nr:hypothetical protein [Flavobacteriales bacterium]
MKISEIIITAILVIGAFVIGFLNNTNTSPDLSNSPTNTTINIESSATNEEQNLIVIKFDLEESEEMEMSVDSLVVDSISQDTLLNIE